MKIKGRTQTVTKPVVYGKRSGCKGTVVLIHGIGAECPRIRKEKGDIFNIANEGVVNNGMRIVKMKGIVEMVGISQNQRYEKCDAENYKYKVAFFHPFNATYGFNLT
jgi:hypothetical protein